MYWRGMRKRTRPKKDETPAWLKSIHQELTSGTTTGESPKDSHVKPPEKSREESLAEALLLLNVTQESLDDTPKIHHLLSPIGYHRIWEYLSGSEEDDAKALLAVHKQLNRSQREAVPFEFYCVAAGLSVKKVFGLIAAEAMEQEDRAKQLLFRVRHTEVLQATIDSALDVELGAADRKMLHQAANFVPVPKNSVTFIRNQNNVDNRLQGATVTTVLPPVESTIRRLGDRFNDRVIEVKALPAPETIPDEEFDPLE